jgi:hypothetical protein
MGRSVSYIMEYSRRPADTRDQVGGLPSHLPYFWPRCQACQERMAFVGQLHASDWFPIDGHLALQFYVCEDCQETRKWLHMEALPRSASVNRQGAGVRCRFQPKLYISYVPVEDSMSQWAFNRRKLAEGQLPDKHLRRDKIGGLFPYDGYDSPRITRRNQMIAQFIWQGIGGAVYLYHSAQHGIYPYLYH